MVRNLEVPSKLGDFSGLREGQCGASHLLEQKLEHWNGLPKEAVGAPSLQAFKARLDGALGSLGCWLVTLHIAGGWK